MADELSDEILGKVRRDPQQANPATSGSLSDLIVNGPDAGMMRSQLDKGAKTPPALAARILRASAQTGIPEDDVAVHLDEIEQAARDRNFDAAKFQNSPLVAKWYAESPNRIKVAEPDVNGLIDLEQAYRRRDDPTRPLTDEEVVPHAEARARRQAKAAQLDTQIIDPSTGLTQDIPPLPEEQVYKAVLEKELATRRAEEAFNRNPGKVGFFESLTQKWRQNPLFMVPVGGALPELQNALELYGAAKRVQAKNASEDDVDMLARYARMETAAQRRGHSLSGKLAEIGADLPAFVMEMALSGGAGNVARVGAKQAVGGVVKGFARKAVGTAAEITTQAAIVEGLKMGAGTLRRQTPVGEATVTPDGNYNYEIKTDKGESVWMSLGKEGVGALIGIGAMHIPMGPLNKILSGEFGEIGATTLTNRLLNVGKEGVKGALSGITINEATKLAKAIAQVGPAYELPSTDELLAQGGLFGGMGAVHGGIAARKAIAADRTIAKQREIIDNLKSNDPVLQEKALSAMTKGTAEEFVYLPADQIREFYQSKGLDPSAEMTKVLGSATAYEAAADAKQRVQIPTSRYAMTIDRDPEAAKFFQPHVTFDPMDASKAEIEVALKAAEESAKTKPEGAPAAPAEAPSSQQQADESAQQVGKFIQGRMKELGFTREAEAYGKLWEERYKARAERRGLGELPAELLDKEALGIFKREGPGGEAPQGEAQYVKVLEQGGRQHVERVPGATPAEGVQHAGEMFPDATVEPMTPEEVKSLLTDAMGGGTREFMQGQKPPTPAFFSKLQKTIEEKMPARASAQQVDGIIKDIKAEERHWLGIDTFLRLHTKDEVIDKQQLLDYLKMSDLSIREVMKGEAKPLEWEQDGDTWIANVGNYAIKFMPSNQKYRLVGGIGTEVFDSLEAAQKQANYYASNAGENKQATKFDQYTLPGGHENYRELLLTMSNEAKLKDLTEQMGKLASERHPVTNQMLDEKGWHNLASQREALQATEFKAGHFSEPNVFAHVRFNDRVDSDGKKVLFIEEIQSDWHQKGRKHGYDTGEKKAALKQELKDLDVRERELNEKLREANKWLDSFMEKHRAEMNVDTNLSLWQIIEREGKVEEWNKREALFPQFNEIRARRDAINYGELNPHQAERNFGVPDAPFKKTWHEFALKRMIRYAAENGYDKVAWTTGEQQAERYDLSKQVEKVVYQKNPDGTYKLSAFTHDERGIPMGDALKPEEIEAHVGKELAKKIVDGEGKDWNLGSGEGTSQRDIWKSFSGVDLKVGGEGMKGFYDDILPAAANKLGKKYGATVSDSVLTDEQMKFSIARSEDFSTGKTTWIVNDQDGKEVFSSESKATAWAELERRRKTKEIGTVHSMEITPALKDAALNQGFSLFQPGDQAPRASIEFGTQGTDINLFRGANRSSFLHESGHKWLDELITDATTTGTPEQLGKDLNTVLKWLGSDVVADQGAGAVRRALTEQQQEKWARAIEAYLLKGEAPSAELRGVFYRFATWLKRIYDSVLGIEKEAGQKLDISPEVREVMDRMLATDKQIEEAKQVEGVNGLANLLAKADWIPQTAKDEILKAVGDVDQAAREELNQKLMAEVRKEESAQWEREREGVRAQIAAEVDQRPEQIALANLERGTRPDGTKLDENDLSALKISKQAAIDAYGPEALNGVPRRIFAKDGVTPDEAAEYFGLSSGSEMLAKFREMRAPQTEEERVIHTKLEGLELQRKLLMDEKQPLAAEAEEAIKNLKAGRKTLANKLERAIRDEEKAKIEPIAEILKDIRDRGGIEPSTPTEDLPKGFRAKKGDGVGSDEIAQELADRGYLDYPDSDHLYKKLAEWQKQVQESRERAADAPKEARRLAGERVSSSIEALIENSTQQEQLRVQLARIQSETAAFKKEHHLNQRESLVDRLTDEKMHERFPDMLTDGTLPDEASKVVYNAKRAQLMSRAMELLAEHKLPAMKKMFSVFAKRGGFSDVMRAQAEEKIGGQMIREITPGIYKSAARKAAAESVEAFLKGDWREAFEANRRELLNHELYRMAEKVRDKIDRDVEYMSKFNKDEVRAKLGKAGWDYRDVIDELMERHDFRKGISLREIDRRTTLRSWYNDQVQQANAGEGFMPDIPPNVLDEAFRKHYKDMTFEEFQEVVDAARNIEHLAQLKNRLLASVEKRNLDETVDRGVKGIEENSPGPRKLSLEPRRPGVEKKARTVEGFFASMRKMASLAREMDGFKDNGAIWDMIIRPANKAGNREATMQAKAAEEFGKLHDLYDPADHLRMSRLEYIPEIQDSLSRWGQIMVALNSGNEGNLQRLRDGYRWTDTQIQAIRDRLSAKDWEFVRGVWKLIDSYWPEIRDLHERVTGLDPEKIEAKPFQTKFGEQPGGYFPIKYEPIRSPAAAEHVESEEAKPTLLGVTLRATTRHGHREARMEHVEQPLRLDPGVISEHLNQVIHDLTHYEFITDTNRLLANDRLQKAMIDHYGDQNFRQLKSWLKDIAVGEGGARNEAEKFLNWIRQGSVIARLGWNLKQFITDQTGLLQGMQRVGPVWVAKAWGSIAGDALRLENANKMIEAKSEFMANRARTRIREVSEIMNRITKKEWLELAVDVGLDKVSAGHLDIQGIRYSFFKLLAMAQKLQDGPIWLGAYEKALFEHKVESEKSPADRELVEKRAVDLADQAVLDSFGGGQLKDLAQTQRGHPAWKVFTTFGSFANVTLQRNIEAVKRWSREPASIGSHFQLATDLMLVNFLPAAMTTAIGYALSANKEKDKKHLKREFIADQVGGLINQVPLGREFSPSLHGHDYEGPAGTELFQTGNRLISSAIEAVSHKDAKRFDWRAANQTAGSLLHYPATFVQRAADAIVSAKKSVGDSVKTFLGGRRKK